MVSSPARTPKTSSAIAPTLANQSSVAAQQAELHLDQFKLDLATQAQAGSGWGGLDLPQSRLFGTDGIRGKAGELLTAPLAMQVGFWAGHVLQAHATARGSVVIGQDSRHSSGMLAMALSAGLTAAGLDVWDLGLCPTPGVAHLTHESGAIGGVMISASHNPPEDNGIKFFGADGSKLAIALQTEIEAALRGTTTSLSLSHSLRCGHHHYRPELIGNYLTAIQIPLLNCNSGALPLAGMRVVLDLAWGAAARLAPQAFEALGAEVIALHAEPDGDRINVNCGSTHLAQLQATVQTTGAIVGFAFDGDADRVLAVDCQGRAVDGDYILYLWGQTLRQDQQLPGNTIVATVMSNLGFERAWERQGGKLVRAAVGDQYVHAEMVRHGAALGGEQSGHILCRHFGVSGDGLLTALHLAALIQQSGTSLTDLINQSFQTYPQRLQNVRVEDRTRRLNWQDCDPLKTAIVQAEAAMGDQGRVLVRASGTEPVIRVMVEAVTPELVNHWTETLSALVTQHLAA